MHATDNLVSLSHVRTARACTKPTTAGDFWAQRHGMPDQPGVTGSSTASELQAAIDRERAINAGLVTLATGIASIP